MELFTPPREFDGYKLMKLLGKGGMGAVYLALDTQLDRPVAVKFILTDDDPSARRRFMVEARAAARLQHPNVVSIYRVGETNRMPYIVSELIRGKALDEIELPVTYAHALKIGIGVARGLSAAHRRGVIHRDIKPANAILSDDGEVKLLDFGIAKLMPHLNDPAVVSMLPSSPSPPRTTASPKTIPLDTFDRVVEETRPVDMEWAHAAAVDERNPANSTSDNVILGTPQFMAPEVWRGDPSDFQSDIYSFGMLLYTLCVGRPAHTAENLLQLRNKIIECDAPSLTEAAPYVDPRFAAVVDRCLSRDRAQRFSSIGEVKSALDRLQSGGPKVDAPDQNPYRGLFAFEAEHKDFFFGRDMEIRTILERLETEPFVLAAGDSGVGKSSLCRAGVLTRLEQSEKPWMTVCLVPGRRPLLSMASALSSFLSESEPSIVESISKDPASAARALRARAKEKNVRLMIFIDQLEELSTVSAEDEVDQVCNLLSHLCMPSPDIRVLATARSDFLGRLALLSNLENEIPRALMFINPMTADGIREAVTGPAELFGVTFESQSLVDELVSSCAADGGGLPLLQFTLAELWRLRDEEKQTISKSALDALGGVSGALTRHADNVLSQMPPKVGRAAKSVLQALVTTEGTRARKTEKELCENIEEGRHALEALVRGRLLTVKAGADADDATYEIAHEVLIREWGTLAGWLRNDADRRIVVSRLQAAAKEWMRLGRSKQALWGDRQLGETLEISLTALPPLERSFLLKSKRGLLFRKIKLIAAVSAVPIFAVLIWSGIRFKAEHDLMRQVDLQTQKAEQSTIKAESLRRTAAGLRQAAMKKFDEMNPDDGEKMLALCNEDRRQVTAMYQKAAEDLESALLLAPFLEDVRQKFAALLYQRALLAEESSAQQEKEEFLKRMSLYDADGGFRRKWEAPGRVTFHVVPDDAWIMLYRYERTGDQKLKETLQETPLTSEEAKVVAQGSYVAVIDKQGFRTIRYPFVVGRSEILQIPIALPSVSSVPEGYAYIPAGRFLFGSAAEDNLRRDFFHTSPLHSVRTKGYLIALKETTFREWFRYIDSMPEAERPSRLPRVDKGGFQGALSIRTDADGMRSIAFQPTVVMFTAQEGENVHYQGRARFQEQNWLEFPVSGISEEDAKRYTQWLNDSDALRGARLCTDLEWERAARGADNREYPNGDTLSEEDANFDASYGKTAMTMGPDEVGSHPSSNSPFGLSDMAGNVFEWTVSSIRRNETAARGGSFLFGPNTARVTEREITEPSFRDVSVGMRVCADFEL
jgi:serine/threonine protein kinase/formylglycine-generating enzyme required for sulfatase activity